MALIYETENFVLESHENPEICRDDGGHIKISPKRDFLDRTELSPKESIELMRLTIVSWLAMKDGMLKNWVEIWRINYQENWNWKPHLHIHLYGRAVNAKHQKYWNPVVPGNKPEYKKLTGNDISAIREEIIQTFQLDKFSDKKWGL